MSGYNKRKCFTFIWTLENISYCWQKRDEYIESPHFVINELLECKYHLQLYPRGLSDENYIICFLHRTRNGPGVRIDCEFSLLSKEGSVLTSSTSKDECDCACTSMFEKVREIFDTKRSVYLPDDKLTVRCRIWKNEGELTKNVQCFARSRICIETNSFLWNIKNFSNIRSGEKRNYQIKSNLDNDLLLTFDLLSKNTFTDEDLMTIQLVAENGKIKHFVFSVTLLNNAGSANKRIRKEFLFCENKKPKLMILPFSKNDLIANKNICLPNDVLILRCDCTFSTGKILEEFESMNYDCDRFKDGNLDNHCLVERNTVSASKRVLNENLQALFHDSILSDIKLQTNTKTYFAHKSFLSARSPVFKAMFESDMKEKINECVDIQDMDSDTVYRMLQYIYTAEIRDLQYENACNLYRAADKYEILALRDECSAYLQSNLCPKNAGEVLILADLHQDEDLKTATQDFIFNHDVVNAEEWKQLMKSHVNLAAETMHLQIQRKTRQYPDCKLFSFGSILAKTPSALPECCCNSEKTMTAISELNSSNRSIPSTSPGLSSNVAKKPLELPYSLGVCSVTTTSASSGFNSNIEKKPLELIYSLGVSSATTTSASSGFSSNVGKKSLEPPHSLGVSSGTTTSASPSLSSNVEKNPLEMPYSLGVCSVKTSAASGFISNVEKKPLELLYSLGVSSVTNTSSSPGFSSSVEKKPLEPPYSLGVSSVTTTSASSGFNNIIPEQTLPTPISFSNSSEKTYFKKSFTFGISSANLPIKPSCLFGNTEEKKPVEPSFSFGSNSKKISVEPLFSFGSNSSNASIKPLFLFSSNSNCTPAKPSLSYGRRRRKTTVKPSTLVRNDREETAPLFPGVTSSKEQTSSIILDIDRQGRPKARATAPVVKFRVAPKLW